MQNAWVRRVRELRASVLRVDRCDDCGAEEYSDRALEVVVAANHELAALRAENERLKATSVLLTEIAELRADRDRWRTLAIERGRLGRELGPSSGDYDEYHCGCCGHWWYKGHAPDCAWIAAFALVEGEE